MFDTHMHTLPFSTDSEMTLDEVLDSQKCSGLGIILTEHMDYDFPGPDYFGFDPSEYFRRYMPHRSGQLLLGVEIGLLPQAVSKNQSLVKEYPFDMVIGSVHAVNGFDIYFPEYFDSFQGRHQAYQAYLSCMLENLKLFDDFDTLGHIDYICRSAPYADKEMYYPEFSDLLDEILRLLLEKGKVLELNTRRLDNAASRKALLPLYQRYYELGGRYVTIGSDAHRAPAIGANMDAALAFSRECGLTPVVFCRRKMQPAE